MDLVSRYYPKPGFLEEVREITEKNNIVLIFDEIPSIESTPEQISLASVSVEPYLE